MTIVIVLVLGAALVIRLSGSKEPSRTNHAQGMPHTTQTMARGVPSATNPTGSAGAADDVRLLTALPPVQPGSSKDYPAISGSELLQPDLYARAFATELLTQDYQHSRAGLLAWVQAESAQSSEARVVGLVPAGLRSKLAVYSLTESADGSSVPIPSAPDWAAWQRKHAFTSVTVQKVVEPIKWSQAVAAGQLTDPGVTEREVDALVTTHWAEGKRQRTAKQSVALTFNLEGPPSRTTYGFVTAVIYTLVPVN